MRPFCDSCGRDRSRRFLNLRCWRISRIFTLGSGYPAGARSCEGLDRIDNGSGDILRAQAQAFHVGTAQIGVGQAGLTHLHIPKVATPEDTASKVRAIEVGILEVAFVEFGPLKYAETALGVASISTREEQVAPFGFSEA